jgi:Abnormal spindle-like microcephaly-assoc'd, ASPM-SPD-2-Hydin
VALGALALLAPGALGDVATSPLSANSPVTFGSRAVGTSSSSQGVTVTNVTGSDIAVDSAGATIVDGNTGSFHITNDGCANQTLTANSGNSCTVQVQFQPQAVGSLSADVQIAYSSGSTEEVSNVTGTGTGSPTADPSPASKAFGSVLVGNSSAAQTFTLTNNGTSTLNVTSASISTGSANYVISNNGCSNATVGVGNHCSVDVAFRPISSGAHPGNLRFVDDAGDSPQDVTLTGTGLAPTADPSPASMNFGNVHIGTPSAATLTINNNGNSALHVATLSVTSGNGSFAVSNNGCAGATVAAGNGCTATVTFTPNAVGGRTGDVTVTDDAGDSPQDVPLSGTGTSPNVSIMPASISFGSLTVGKQGPPHTITVTDTGNGDMSITTVKIAGTNVHSFVKTSDNCANSTVTANGGTCTIDVAFYPHAAGALTAQLQISDNVAGGLQTVTFSGTGVPPANVPGVTKAVGCTKALITWKPLSGTPGFLGVRIVRTKGRHIPVGPGDGTVRPKTSPGVLLDTGLAFGAQYNYGVFSEWRFSPTGPIVWSSGVKESVRTQRICTPMNHAATQKTTPTISWLPYTSGAFYIVQIKNSSGNLVFPHHGKATSFTVPAGVLQRGKGYRILLFAYTKLHPRGIRVGDTTFHIV